jgi:isopenicillin-N N-acyltransferase-like protein
VRDLPFLETKGSARERGRQHGEAFRGLIAAACRRWKYPGSGDRLRETLIKRTLTYLHDYYPEIVHEITGISEGARLPFEDVLWLSTFNAHPHIPDWRVDTDGGEEKWCTGVVLRGKGTAYLGKTSDIDELQRGQYLLEKATTETGAAYFSLRWVGNVWTEVGLNSAGLAVGANSGPVIAQGQDGYGIPQHAVLTVVLNRCGTVEQAVETLSRMVMCGKGQNIALADSGGSGAVVEKSFDRFGVIPLETGVGAVFTTNHCVTAAFSDIGVNANSQRRYLNLQRLLTLPDYPEPLEMLRDVLADHSQSGAICQHGQDGLHTLISCIADPKERRLLVNPEPGCARSYRRYEISEETGDAS